MTRAVARSVVTRFPYRTVSWLTPIAVRRPAGSRPATSST
jgi:hypothetical protein